MENVDNGVLRSDDRTPKLQWPYATARSTAYNPSLMTVRSCGVEPSMRESPNGIIHSSVRSEQWFKEQQFQRSNLD
jgi:hypothetical protein